MTANIHKSVVAAIDEIDAAMYSGDTFLDAKNAAYLANCLARWTRGLVEFTKQRATTAQQCKDGKILYDLTAKGEPLSTSAASLGLTPAEGREAIEVWLENPLL